MNTILNLKFRKSVCIKIILRVELNRYIPDVFTRIFYEHCSQQRRINGLKD